MFIRFSFPSLWNMHLQMLSGSPFFTASHRVRDVWTEQKESKKKTFCPPPSALKRSDQLYLLPHESQGEDNLRRVTIAGGQVIFFNLVGQKRQARLDNRHFWAGRWAVQGDTGPNL